MRKWKDTEVCVVEQKGEKVMSLAFQVAAVHKPLIAVKRITEKGIWNIRRCGDQEQ